MNEEPQTAGDSWREAAEWFEQLIEEGDGELRALLPVVEFVSAHGYAETFWAHPLRWGLVIAPSPEPEGEPYLVIQAYDGWLYYDIQLKDRARQPVVGWSCDGEQELEWGLAEALGRLRLQGGKGEEKVSLRQISLRKEEEM